MSLYNSRCLSVYCLFSLMLCTQYSVGDQVRISTFEHETAQMDFSIKVMTSIYQRLGHDMLLIRFPGKRSLVEANQGTVDGELIRVKAIANQVPNLVRIPTSVGRLKAMALTLTESPAVTGMGGLIGKKVGIIRGVELTDRITRSLTRQVLNSIDSLFQALLKGRVDVILFPEFDAKKYMEQHDLMGKIIINKAPIIEVPLFHYIHKSQPSLIQEMTEILGKLEESGELDGIILSAEQARL
ncbi:MAG: transporter substrate-binding domain-containing protein [Oleispira sp.]